MEILSYTKDVDASMLWIFFSPSPLESQIFNCGSASKFTTRHIMGGFKSKQYIGLKFSTPLKS